MRAPPVTLIPLLTASLGVVIAAQQRAPAPPPVFRALTEHVAVDVVVTDGSDKIVTGLTRDDFVITEGNRQQRIDDFAFISIPPSARAIDLDAPPPPPSDVGSNADSPRASRAIAFIIDNTSIKPQDLLPLKRAMTDFLKSLSPDDQVALTYTSRSDLGQDFTNDAGRLIASVNHRKAAIGTSSFSPDRDRKFALRNAVTTLAASRQTRRAIILVSSVACLPFGPSGLPDEECIDLIKRARQADVPIYTIDPRIFTDANSVQGIGNIDASVGLSASNPAVDSMRTLASATGARGFAGMADVAWAVNEIMVENGSYYVLGFYPNPIVNDGEFHEIKVTVTRPGLRVRARPGYLAGSSKVVPSTPTRDMTKALGAGRDDPSLPIRAFVAPLAATPRGMTRAAVTIELAYPLPEAGATALDDELRVGILALTPDAKIKASFQRPIRFTGTWKPSARGTFVINEVIDLPTEPLTVRVGVTSRALGKTGTAHVKVDVPDFTDNDLQLSHLVLASTAQALDAAVGLNNLRGLVPFQPATARTFSSVDTLRVFARAFWKSKAEAIDVEIRVTGGTSSAPRPFTLRGVQLRSGPREAVLDATLPLVDLRPGSYVLRVEARQPSGKPSAREVPIQIR